MNRLKKLIEAYNLYAEREDFTELDIDSKPTVLDIAYTTLGDSNQLELQISYNIKDEVLLNDVTGSHFEAKMKEEFSIDVMAEMLKTITFSEWVSGIPIDEEILEYVDEQANLGKHVDISDYRGNTEFTFY